MVWQDVRSLCWISDVKHVCAGVGIWHSISETAFGGNLFLMPPLKLHDRATEELREDGVEPSSSLQTLAFNPRSSSNDFVSCILKGTTKSLSKTYAKRPCHAGEPSADNIPAITVTLGCCFLSGRFTLFWKTSETKGCKIVWCFQVTN